MGDFGKLGNWDLDLLFTDLGRFSGVFCGKGREKVLENLVGIFWAGIRFLLVFFFFFLRWFLRVYDLSEVFGEFHIALNRS